jgi:hypothetical protein
LPFVPAKAVIKAFKKIQQIAETCTKFNPMLVYLNIGKLIRGSTTVRKLTMYPIKQWNVVSRILNDKAKTNNSLESWHKAFACDAYVHPTVTKLVKK